MANSEHHAEPLLEKPVRPPGRFFKGDPAARQYAVKRSAWMRQQARLHPKPKKPAPTDPEEIFAVRVKRLIKAENARAEARRSEELDEFLSQIARKLSPEEIRALVGQLQTGRDRHQEQAAEIMRVAEAPEKLERLGENLGRPSLFGEWTKCKPVNAERVGSGGYVEPMEMREREESSRRRELVNEVSSQERDLLHALLGHGLEAGALPRDEQFDVTLDAEGRACANALQAELTQKFGEIQESGRVPSAEEIAEMAAREVSWTK
jgi:hypothetical protein